MTKKTALFGLLVSGIVLISTIDTSAQRRSGNRAGTPGGRVTSIAVDPSDPSGNTVYKVRQRAVAAQTASNVVAGNKIGTDSRTWTTNAGSNRSRFQVQPNGLQAPGNDLLMEETTIVHEVVGSGPPSGRRLLL